MTIALAQAPFGLSAWDRRPYPIQNVDFLGARRPTLGVTAKPYRRPPMLSNRSPQMGILDVLALIGEYLLKGLSFTLDTLATLVDLPLDILSQGVDIAFNGIAGVIRNIPLVGPILAEIILVGGAIIKFGLTIPGLILRELGNILEGAAQALEAYRTPEEREKDMEEQKQKTIDEAPDPIKDNVKAILDAGGVGAEDPVNDIKNAVNSGKNVTGDEGTSVVDDARVKLPEQPEPGFVEKALPVAIPAAAGALLLVALLR